MTEGIQYDEEWAQRLIKVYTTPEYIDQRKYLVNRLSIQPDERILDIGSGPGLLIEDMAPMLGQQGLICGIDISPEQVALSRKRCARLPQVEIQLGDATAIPYHDGEFDVAVSTQVYEYVADIPLALSELYRVLKPGGRALLLNTDFDTLICHTGDRKRMAHILRTFENHSADSRLNQTVVPKLRHAGFANLQHETYSIINTEFNAGNYSYGLMHFIAAFVVGQNDITVEETEAWLDELRLLDQTGDFFFSINRYIFMVTKPGDPLSLS